MFKLIGASKLFQFYACPAMRVGIARGGFGWVCAVLTSKLVLLFSPYLTALVNYPSQSFFQGAFSIFFIQYCKFVLGFNFNF